ncbi:MAG: hypothetical protein WC606_02515 [Candidatus Absconditabacterales bacterium]|jgi:hypothetical protein
MKTKMLIMLMLLSLFALYSCNSYDENDAKILIKARVPKCVNIVRVVKANSDLDSYDYYAAVDSAYAIHIFSVHRTGRVKERNPKN